MVIETHAVRDADGAELLVGVSFLRARVPGLVAGRAVEFCGVLHAVRTDQRGPLLVIREWRRGSLTARERIARPEHVHSERSPRKLRAQRTARAEARVYATSDAMRATLERAYRGTR